MTRMHFHFLLLIVAGVGLAEARGDESPLSPESVFLPKDSRNGLLVYLGSKEGAFPLALAKRTNWLVHGLLADEESLSKTRQAIEAAGLSGRVSVERRIGERLPYADNMVNVLMVDNIDEMLNRGVSAKDLLRVLTPRGSAFLGYSTKPPSLSAKQLQSKLAERGIVTSQVVEDFGIWCRITKPPLADADEWTHCQYDPSGNPVSRDKLAGPPTALRWLAGPFWPMDRNGPRAAVSAHGRLFYAVDLAPEKQKGRRSPVLFARDAHNGLLLWKKEAPGLVRLAFVATQQRLYTVLTPKGPLVALDTATGEVLETYEEVNNPSWFLLLEDKLLVQCGTELAMLDVRTGKTVWSNTEHAIVPAMQRYPNVAVDQHQLFFVEGEKHILGCLDLRTGKAVWQKPLGKVVSDPKMLSGLAAYQDGVVIVGEWTKRLDGKGIHAFSTKEGKHLWSHTYPLHHSGRGARRKASSCLEGFFIDGLYWIHVGDPKTRKADSWQGLDPLTGTVKKRFAYPPDLRVGESCQPAQATVKYLIGGHREFVDTQTGKYKERAEGVHGGCSFGMLTANGLVYSWSRYTSNYLRGEMGLETHSKGSTSEQTQEDQRLEHGELPPMPPLGQADQPEAEDWPSYRHDSKLSGTSSTKLPAQPVLSWQAKVGKHALSAPVVVGDTVFVAAVDEHRVMALNATDGKVRWSYTANGRVPLPPTIYMGLCLFGSTDGWVYCLNAKSGAMIWRFRAAPYERRIVVRGQLESPWPVSGGVLATAGRAYFFGGRHGSLDGGAYLYAVKATTGKVVWSKHLTETPVLGLLASDGDSLTFGSKHRFSLETGERASPVAIPEIALRPDFLAPAYVLQTETVLDRLKLAGDILALARAGNVGLLATGPPARVPLRKTKTSNQAIPFFPERLGEHHGGELLLFSLTDGTKLVSVMLRSTPTFDGLIAASNRVFLTTRDGKVYCFGSK